MKQTFPTFTGNTGFDFLIILSALALLGWALYEIHWHMKYRKEYSETKTDKGVVTDMDYTPSRSTYNAATKTTSTTSEEHDVYINFEVLGEENFDDEKLYQTVRIDDNVTAEYQEVYRVEKANPRNRVHMYNTINAVISEKGRKVEL